jgi:2'-5' RNA ligase
MQHRLYFALWPDGNTCHQIEEVQTHVCSKTQGRRVLPADFHLTLCFVGDVDPQTYQDMLLAASKVSVPAFDLQLDHCDYWPQAEIVHLGSYAISNALQQLVDTLSAVLKPYGYVSDFPDFKPHVTLVRNVTAAPAEWPAIETIFWEVKEFVLVSSHPQDNKSVYHTEGRYLLL